MTPTPPSKHAAYAAARALMADARAHGIRLRYTTALERVAIDAGFATHNHLAAARTAIPTRMAADLREATAVAATIHTMDYAPSATRPDWVAKAVRPLLRPPESEAEFRVVVRYVLQKNPWRAAAIGGVVSWAGAFVELVRSGPPEIPPRSPATASPAWWRRWAQDCAATAPSASLGARLLRRVATEEVAAFAPALCAAAERFAALDVADACRVTAAFSFFEAIALTSGSAVFAECLVFQRRILAAEREPTGATLSALRAPGRPSPECDPSL